MISWLWNKIRKALTAINFGFHCGRPDWICPTTKIYNIDNITYDASTGNAFRSPGCFFSAEDKITIGSHVWFGPNVGLITQDHDLANPDHPGKRGPIQIGDYCWIGMNAVILPGVSLGDHTVVGAGSVVTHSFPGGHCVLAGNPAKIIRRI